MSWIWSREATHEVAPPERSSPSHYQVRRFRREFELRATEGVAEGMSAVVHVSADSRFLFYCNGQLIGRGPAKGDIHHHFYDTFDLSPYLRAGRNVLAALVLDMSRVAHRPHFLGAPCSVMTYAGGFVLDGSVTGPDAEIDLGTKADGSWQVAIDRAHRFQNLNTKFEGYLGYFEERVDAELPADWLDADADSEGWEPATALYVAERKEERRDPTSPYGLIPRLIPQLEEGPAQRFVAGFRPGGGDLPEGWRPLIGAGGRAGEPTRGVRLEPGQTVEVILDTGKLTTGYPRVDIVGGKGAEVRLTYAEALRLPWDTPGARLMGRKQDLANLASHYADGDTGWTFDRRGQIQGWCDVWHPAGIEATFEPLHWRAFRFIGLTIKVGDEPLHLTGLAHRFSAYPYEVKADFDCSDPALTAIWHAGVHTMRLCSHETFEDCPHYEQMQYAGDTMITSYLGMLTSGDYRLSKQALLHFDWSRITDGLTASRYPSRLLQVIPSWSLHWITSVRDYGLCSGDLDLVKELLPGMRAVLDWFRRHTNDQGLPEKLPYWNITDWCPWWPRGVVPGADTGPTCIISAQFIQALAEVAQMCEWLQLDDEALHLASEAASLRPILHETFWSEEEGLYFDRPGGPEVSQYGNAWAVACGAADDAAKQRLPQRFPHDAKLAPGSFFYWHTAFKAMRALGTYDTMPDHLGPWHESVGLGLDTFVEENSYWRSLCHAWSAHPIFEFLHQVLGVQSTAPGFAALRVQPRRCGLDWARGNVCTPRGPVQVDWLIEDGIFRLRLDAPADTPVEIELPDGSVHQHGGGHWEGTAEVTP